MVKKGKDRSDKFSAKHDPDTIMLRWKALKDFSINRFVLTSEKHFQFDDEIRTLLERYLMPFGQRGNFTDKVRKLVFMWNMLTDIQKQLYRLDWISEGLPSELFDKLADYHYVLSNKVAVYTKTDMVLWYFAELSPLPQEAYSPEEEDYTETTEILIETTKPEPSHYWFQYAMSLGANIFYLGSVFKGRDAYLPEPNLNLLSARADIGLDFTLFISAIAMELPEYSYVEIIENMLYEIELQTAAIERTLTFLNPVFAAGINEYDLWLYQMLKQTVNVFEGQTKTLTNFTCSFCSAYAPAPNYAYLTQVSISLQTARSDTAQVLTTTIPNPSYEVSL
jgi:hypothetical protein